MYVCMYVCVYTYTHTEIHEITNYCNRRAGFKMSQGHDMAVLKAADLISERRWLIVGLIEDTDGRKQTQLFVNETKGLVLITRFSLM